MTTPDLKQAALDFCKEYHLAPSCIIQEAMERAAALTVAALTADVKAVREDMEKHRKEIERGTPHGWSSGMIQNGE